MRAVWNAPDGVLARPRGWRGRGQEILWYAKAASLSEFVAKRFQKPLTDTMNGGTQKKKERLAVGTHGQRVWQRGMNRRQGHIEAWDSGKWEGNTYPLSFEGQWARSLDSDLALLVRMWDGRERYERLRRVLFGDCQPVPGRLRSGLISAQGIVWEQQEPYNDLTMLGGLCFWKSELPLDLLRHSKCPRRRRCERAA